MTKEDFIKSKWIELIGEEKFNTIIIDDDGFLNFETTKDYHSWSLKYQSAFSVKNYNPFKTGADSHIQNVGIRPLSIKGIEKNRGWIKIESEKDLPKNWEQIHFVIKGFEENQNSGYYYDGLFWNLNEAYTKEIVTHYQPIIKPQPPIY